ncbi:glycine cleavage system aminomethyltransferase GcvT [Christensenella timonensis]|uniref:glycine cleavage system aminomethyltransferase GcvT n=1 Tax=Christensenella timonensis TaxID=1816678 RepID=UPI000835EE5D|nr:glycine cleavage system aminomethyltransferase GcvT [Christensenella timonensis]
MEKKTALYDKHVAAGGKMVPFAGYSLPVQYKSGILSEHKAVREKAGLFDVSHMGEFFLAGPDALKTANYILTNDFRNLKEGQARYSPMCYEDGGTVDDLLVYKMAEDEYFIVVNAANKDKDFTWMEKNLVGDVQFSDISAQVSQLALQGPLSEKILQKAAGEGSIPQAYYTFVKEARIAGMPCLVSRTGYTGEDGFEIYCNDEYAERMWDTLMEAGEEYGLIPCGLGARDTLRLEAAMPLYGHELSAEITPREAGLGFAIKVDKDEFIGKEALTPARLRKRIGLKLIDRGIVREGAKVFAGSAEVGRVTSGTMSPTLGAAIALALVPSGLEEETLFVEVRGKKLKAEVVKLPFYKANK